MADELIVEEEDHVVRLTLNRPERRNALTPELIEALIDALGRIDAAGHLRVAILTGAGSAFCAGFDIGRIENATGSAGPADRLCERVRALRVPVIAMVNGVASGTGCDLAVSSDFRLAAETARFQMPPAKLGVLYENGGMARLVQAVGQLHAREMLLTGEPVGASRALAIGLVNRVLPDEQLDGEARRLAQTLAANAPLTLAATKLALNLMGDGVVLGADGAAALEEARRRVWASDDAKEGRRAFAERRPPEFTGA